MSFQSESKKRCFHVIGYENCGYFNKAKCLVNLLQSHGISADHRSTVRQNWQQFLEAHKRENGFHDVPHRTSPLVWEGCDGEQPRFIGGYTQFAQLVRSEFFPHQC